MKSLFIVMALLLPQLSQANFAEEDLFKKWGKPFIEESLGIIHLNLALAVFMSDYYEACLKDEKQTDNDSWFDREKVIYPNNPFLEEKRRSRSSLFSKRFCNDQLFLTREDIKEKYPLMRAYMIIAMNNSPGYVSFQSFYGLAEIPDFSEDEKRLAKQIFDKNVSARKSLLENSDKLPPELQGDPQVVCAFSTKVNESEIRSCFHRRYLELIVGNKETRSLGIPIPLLAFVTSENPSNDELIEGIRKIRQNGSELLDDFKKEYGATMDEKGNTIFGKSFDNLSNSDMEGYFLVWWHRLRTEFDGYQKLKEAGATDDEIQRLLSSIVDYLSQDAEETVCIEDYYEFVDEIIKYILYRPDGARPSYIPVRYLPLSIQFAGRDPMEIKSIDDNNNLWNIINNSCPGKQ